MDLLKNLSVVIGRTTFKQWFRRPSASPATDVVSKHFIPLSSSCNYMEDNLHSDQCDHGCEFEFSNF